jgi:hypothetical protein
MIGKDDWDAAAEELMARERERLGEPPTPEEVVAYSRGELSDEQAERVRALLVAYPQLTDVLTEPPPIGDDVLTDEEVAQDWARLQSRMAAAPAPVVAHRRFTMTRILAIAASLAIVFVALLFVPSRRHEVRVISEFNEPALGQRHVLIPIAQRGVSLPLPYPLPSDGKQYWIAPASLGEHHAVYGLDIFDVRVSPPRRIWSSRSLRVKPDHEFEVAIPRSLLPPGVYRLDVYGGERRLGQYLVRVSR